MKNPFLHTWLIVLAALSGCAGPPAGFEPLDAANTLFWDRQTVDSAELLRGMADAFNAQHPGPPIKIEHAGTHADIYRKTSASIQARKLPAMAVCYESMVAEYAGTGAIVPLDGFVDAPGGGLKPEEKADFFDAILDTNRYSEFGGKMYSFPFAKSVLMMFYNRNVLEEAGIAEPPKTWDEFLAQCRQIKSKTGKYAYAAVADCSTLSGIIYSMGGSIIDGRTTRYDAPETVRAFELFETLFKEDLAYAVTYGTFDDNVALANDRIAFTLRTSASFSAIAQYRNGDTTRWGAAPLPQADPAHPATVLFGPNVCIFSVTPQQQQMAWDFIKYFTSEENSVRWALKTGYVPLRKSGERNPGMQAHWKQWPGSRAAFDSLAYARPEPNIAGWQEVRALVEKAETEVFTKTKNGLQAANDLKKAADAALLRR